MLRLRTEFFSAHYRENDRDRILDGHAAGTTAFREYFPDFRAEVIGLKASVDVVVSRVIFRGTYAGGWAGVDSPGAKIEVSGLDALHFEGRLVYDRWHEADHEGCGSSWVALPPV